MSYFKRNSARHLLNWIPEITDSSDFFRRWGLIGVLVGIGAGCGALALMGLIQLFTHYVLGGIVGYTPPLPGGEGGSVDYIFHMSRPWLLPVVTAGAGLISGLLIWKFAPDTAGIGTNAAIRAFHNCENVPIQTSIFKLATSALTIGSGLTSGREGPIAQIGAATGVNIARLFNLSERQRNIALAAGLGAGIAAIFKAPLAGAIIGAEIFYTEDFEVEALVPGLIASVIGYTIVGSVTGFEPVFRPPPDLMALDHPLKLLLFALLGVCCGLLAQFLFFVFFRLEAVFRKLPLWLATTVGGFCTGLLGLVFYSVIGTGYGWAQFAISHNVQMLPPLMLLGAAVAEIVGASLTLGSGNSGGIFGPCIVTGGMFGASFGYAAARIFPSLNVHPGNFAIVGMMAFFAAAAKAPLSTIIMISEMTGGYGLLGPAMFAVVTAFVFSGKKTIFPAQVKTRIESPFHADEFEPIVLRRFKTVDVMIHLPVCVNSTAPLTEAMGLMGDYGLASLPVVEQNKLCGRVTLLAIHRVGEYQRSTTQVREIVSRDGAVAYLDEDLFAILRRFAAKDVGNLPVVTREQPERPIGLVTRSGLWAALETAKQQTAEKREAGGTASAG